MSKPKQVITKLSRDQKRAEFSGPARKASNRKKVLLGLFLSAFGVAGYLAVNNPNGQDKRARAISAAPGPAVVRIPLVELDGGQAKFFDYKTGDNQQVRFFAMKSSDGVYRAALDACDVCWQSKKGYVQDGDDMICRKCGQHFRSAKINEVTGDCNPMGLPRTIADGHLVIPVSGLETGRAFF
jgi:uncharacterized membrane protein